MSEILTINHAIDLWLGELARRGRRERTITTYRWILWQLASALDGGRRTVQSVTTDDCRRFLDRWANTAPSTMGQRISCLNGFFLWLYRDGRIPANPMERIERPPKKRPEYLDVVTVDEEDVLRLFAAARTWPEALCVTLLAYLGPRRHALAQLRWRDVNLAKGEIRFREKGGETHVKRIPDELHELLTCAVATGALDTRPDAYVVPSLRPAALRRAERDDRVIWDIVKTVAGRAGVTAHVHSLRAAFATRFLEQRPDQLFALKEIMGHKRLETTAVYLRRLKRERAMEALRDLSWGFGPRFVFDESADKAHTGFEPVLPGSADPAEPSPESAASAAPLVANPHIRVLLERLRAPQREGRQ